MLAEAGVNHEGSMDLARRLIDEAAEGGAHGIKFQSYKAATLASKDSPAYWDTTKEPTGSQFELFKKHDKFWKKEFEQLKTYCDEVGIEFFSTPFDVESADFLDELMTVYKISSSDITNQPFIQYMCAKGKPIVLSTGASNLDEIEQAVALIEGQGNALSLMHCILNYPTDDENANLGMITDLRARFPQHLCGYSDHTLPRDMQNCITANLLGAVVLEKHFTFDKKLPGNDHYHAMDLQDLKVFTEMVDRVYRTVGSINKAALASEEISRRNARRSLVATRSIKAGEELMAEHLTWKRPAHGISPMEMAKVVGTRAIADIAEDAVLQWDMLQKQ